MLSTDMKRYVELHRAVGFKFHTQHQLLSSFAAFADAHGDEFVRIERALDWASRSSVRRSIREARHDRARTLSECFPARAFAT